jgi:hypothetical protein
MLSQLPESCQQTLQATLANSINVLSIVSSHVYFPTTSSGLKDVAGFLARLIHGGRFSGPAAMA